MQISRETLSYKKGKRIKASKTETSFKHTYISYKKKKPLHPFNPPFFYFIKKNINHKHSFKIKRVVLTKHVK
jgi:hypothetical protein